jgi:hypothetical protein
VIKVVFKYLSLVPRALRLVVTWSFEFKYAI